MGAGGGAIPDFGGTHEQQVNIVKLFHHLYRGRYLLTLTLASIGLLIGALLGFLLNKPRYKSTATIKVEAMNLRVDQNDTMRQDFDSFVKTHVAFAQHDRVIGAAMSSPEWLAMQRPTDIAAEKAFRSGYSVEHGPKYPGLIFVNYSDIDPQAAHVGITQAMRAFDRIFVQGQGELKQKLKLNVLMDERAKLDQTISDHNQRVLSLTEELGSSDPQLLDDFNVRRRITIEADITELELRLIGKSDPAGTQAATQENPEKPARAKEDMSYEEIALADAKMNQLLVSLSQAIQELDIKTSSGMGPRHREIVQANGIINGLRARMEERRKAWVRGETNPEDFNAAVEQGLNPLETVPMLKNRLAELKRQLERVQNESRELAGKIQELRNRKDAVETAKERLKDVDGLIQTLRNEMQLSQKFANVDIIYPEKAPSAVNDDRRMRWAAILGMMLAMVPVGIIGIYGLFDRRYRYSDEALEEGPHNTTMLGILPRLPNDLHDVEQAAAAAHCVHQIRTLMQIGGAGRKVFAVTSSNPGDGKTSMTLSLGLSFAGSGSRTLLVDLDMVGQGLSRGLRLREQSGLFNILLNGDIRSRIRKTHIDRLSLLPTGLDDDHRAANRLADPMIQRLIHTVRDDYDIVLIDTGPVLGSIEAHLVCAQADGVVLVVGAGRARGQVKAAVDQLHRVGARLLGLVFNLAQPKDFKTSAASQSFRSVRPEDDRPTAPPITDFPELEPLPRVVALDTKRV
jgi:capsular exopolysaccharide synthesis family protein